MNAFVRLLVAFIALSLTSCGGASIAAPSQLASPSPSLDPAVVQHLQLNNSRFERKPLVRTPAVSSDQAIVLAQQGLTGTLSRAVTQYGQLYSPLLGARSDRAAWLVTLDGVAPPVLGAPGQSSPTGALRTYAFIDAEDGRGLMMFAEGAGPPP